MLVVNIEQPSLVTGVLGCQTGQWKLEERTAMCRGAGNLECHLFWPMHSFIILRGPRPNKLPLSAFRLFPDHLFRCNLLQYLLSFLRFGVFIDARRCIYFQPLQICRHKQCQVSSV